jgi:hypothetical protein
VLVRVAGRCYAGAIRHMCSPQQTAPHAGDSQTHLHCDVHIALMTSQSAHGRQAPGQAWVTLQWHTGGHAQVALVDSHPPKAVPGAESTALMRAVAMCASAGPGAACSVSTGHRRPMPHRPWRTCTTPALAAVLQCYALLSWRISPSAVAAPAESVRPRGTPWGGESYCQFENRCPLMGPLPMVLRCVCKRRAHGARVVLLPGRA